MKNDGSGNFTGQDLATERQNVKPLFVADFNSDGDKDIVANQEDYWVILLDNDGSENFTEGARDTALWRRPC